MKSTITCTYCAYWQASPVHNIITNNDEANNNGKKKNKKDKIKQYRICKLTNRRIKGTTKACRYFKARLYFYCHTYKYWLSIYQCLSRKRNRKSFLKHANNPSKKTITKYMYPDCTSRCSQFKEEILPICKKLKINRSGQIERPKLRKIKRRPKQEPRVIKRRDKKVVRSITRRDKKVRRVIKRRE